MLLTLATDTLMTPPTPVSSVSGKHATKLAVRDTAVTGMVKSSGFIVLLL
jgi:hypothetical protein